ncbi:hypothetical protein ACISU4_21065 [Streptomyces wuyuanensis]|uniref:hypothetical protein n=1 Tax=Streptomyces wuyuanensis TaxID=1196353 RepID=UPI0038309AAE
MAARGTDGMTDVAEPGAESARAVTAAGRGKATERAPDGRGTDPAGGSAAVDPAGGTRTGQATGRGGTDPAGDAATAGRGTDGVEPGQVRARTVRAVVPALFRLGARAAAAVRRGRTVPVVLAVATVVTTALSLWLGLRVHEQRVDEQRRQDVLAAARRSALNFTSLDYRHYARDSANVLEGATGDFKEQFAAQTAELTKLVAANKSVSEGQVLEAGIARSDERTARVLVVADSKVTNSAAPEGQSRTYRLQLDLVLEGGRWLTSNVEFVG